MAPTANELLREPAKETSGRPSRDDEGPKEPKEVSKELSREPAIKGIIFVLRRVINGKERIQPGNKINPGKSVKVKTNAQRTPKAITFPNP